MNLRNPWVLLFLILALSAVLQLVFPWWSLAVGAFAVGFGLAQSGKQVFWAGFGGTGLSWLLPAAWLSYQNNGLLAHRMAQLLPLGGSATALVVVAAIVAGLVGGLAALAGVWLRQALQPRPQPN
ncbi:MAG: hypothetical protein JWR44_530 [Hymenobacter sp.]|jgi:hypothetical protein|nr:hypothetical protein [Hymenobacter sp.]